MRFTLPKMFLAVTLAAVACAGMTLRTRWWADSIVTLTVLLYLVVGILALRQPGQVRAFRIVFALVGIGYLLLIMCGIFAPLRDSMLTSRALVLAGKALQVPTQPVAQQVWTSTSSFATGSGIITGSSAIPTVPPPKVGTGTLTLSGPVTTVTAAPFVLGAVSIDSWDYLLTSSTFNTEIPAVAFIVIGHCAWSWLIALLAAWLAAAVYGRRETLPGT